MTTSTPTPGSQQGDLPLVSVVIPTRGRPELVRVALASVVGQTYGGPLEIFVVHDQEEPDRSLEQMATATRSVRVMLNTHRLGLSGSRNTGLDVITAEFYASCDDDDSWHPTKLAVQMERMLREPELAVLGAGIRLLMPQDRIVDWPGASSVVTERDLLRSRKKELHSSTLLVRSDVFKRIGGYDELLPNSYAEDYEFLLRAVKAGRIGVVNQPLADIKKDGQSWFRERESVVAEALEYLLKKHPQFDRCRPGQARVMGQIAYAKATLGQRRAAMSWARRAFASWPVAPHAGLALAQSAFGMDPRWALKSARVVGRGLS